MPEPGPRPTRLRVPARSPAAGFKSCSFIACPLGSPSRPPPARRPRGADLGDHAADLRVVRLHRARDRSGPAPGPAASPSGRRSKPMPLRTCRTRRLPLFAVALIAPRLLAHLLERLARATRATVARVAAATAARRSWRAARCAGSSCRATWSGCPAPRPTRCTARTAPPAMTPGPGGGRLEQHHDPAPKRPTTGCGIVESLHAGRASGCAWPARRPSRSPTGTSRALPVP